ncbi:sigma-70 family RNA polymerase sigma factor [Actinoplanes sp. NPDC051343]|uniref:sigma-70 family RNA polymerase sigma factor n=1 Tax=Actinoplanes sp. NPDC051343 TaxID=3363906 RepID=UPI0037B80FFC
MTIELHARHEQTEPAPDERIASLKARHGRPLFDFLVRLTYGQRHLAEDLLQETMIRAWCNLDRMPADDDGTRRWLFVVARRIAIDAARMRQVRPTEVDLMDFDVVSSANPTTDTVLATDALRCAIRGLTPEQRMILNELYVHGSSTQETADRLGMPLGTVKSRTFHALRHLREAMSGPG